MPRVPQVPQVSPVQARRLAQRQLESFIDKFSPEIAAIARASLRKMEQRMPGATRLVYDNYNALAIGFGPHARASDAVFSIAVFPRWVSLFFLYGAELEDANKILKGSGNRVRHIVLGSARDLDSPTIRSLMADALKLSDPLMPSSGRGSLIIKSISPKQRPRRPTVVSRRRR